MEFFFEAIIDSESKSMGCTKLYEHTLAASIQFTAALKLPSTLWAFFHAEHNWITDH